MSALTLYQIHDELQAWSNSLELAETPEERAEIQQRISAWLQAGKDKVDSFNAYLAHLEAQSELAKAEVDRIDSIRRKIERVADELKEYAVSTMEALDVRKLEGNTSSLALRAKPVSVLIEQPKDVPLQYQDASVQFPAELLPAVMAVLPASQSAMLSMRKADIAKAIKAGIDVPGATLALGGNSLVRK